MASAIIVIMKQKRYEFSILLLSSVAIILLSIFLIKNNNQENTPTPTHQQTPPSLTPTNTQDTSDWKIYTNNKYGFKVEFPSNWESKETDSQVSLRLTKDVHATEPLNFYYYNAGKTMFEFTLTDPNNADDSKYTHNGIVFDNRGVAESLVISVRESRGKIDNTYSLEQEMRDYFEEGRIVTNTTLSGHNTLRSMRNKDSADENIRYLAYGGYDEEVNVFFNNNLYSIYYNGNHYEPYFDQILSTFQFTK
jgi:hypothetical protein